MARRVDYDSPRVMAEARRKLAEMYAAEDTAGRTHIGRKLDYKGKPENIRAKIVEGKLQKWFKENSLLEQPFVKDPERTVRELVDAVSAKTGERISVARFVRFQVGGA